MDPYQDFAPFYDLYVGDRPDDVRLYVDYAKRIDGPILEIGAGTGRVTLPMARGGSQVVAVD